VIGPRIQDNKTEQEDEAEILVVTIGPEENGNKGKRASGTISRRRLRN
jgi:hypothetical protein